MRGNKIFCVIPAYNEEENISGVIESLDGYFDCIVVVDDGSSDNTSQVLRKKSKDIDETELAVLKHPLNRGQGAALETGNQYCRHRGAEIVVHFDADGQFLADEISELVEPIKKGDYDIVFGSRFMGKDSNMPFFKKRFIMPLGRLANKIFFGLDLTDPQNGFRVMGSKALKEIIIEQDGSAHCTEILAKTAKYGLRFKEVPVTVKYFDYGQGLFSGKGRGKGGLRILKDLFLAKLMN